MDHNLNTGSRKAVYVLMKTNGVFLCQWTGLAGQRWSPQIGHALQAKDMAVATSRARRIADTVARWRENKWVQPLQFNDADRYCDFRDLGIYRADAWLSAGGLAPMRPYPSSVGRRYLHTDFVSVKESGSDKKQTYLGFSTIGRPATLILKAVGFDSAEEAGTSAQRRVVVLTYCGEFNCG